MNNKKYLLPLTACLLLGSKAVYAESTNTTPPIQGSESSIDSDQDGIADFLDNCPTTANPQQWNKDQDKFGNACDSDIDGDGFSNETEKAAGTLAWDDNSKLESTMDIDNDGITDNLDNCMLIANPNQWDTDHDGQGNKCDPDVDGDGFTNNSERAQGTGMWNASSFPNLPTDEDADGINDNEDNCPTISNMGQWDKDKDGLGNECDDDLDGDGFANKSEDAFKTNAWDFTSYPIVDPSKDRDSDAILDENDNCPDIANNKQWDKDQDGIGNDCDNDIDGDGYANQTEIAFNTKIWDHTSFPDFPPEDDKDGDGLLNDNDNCPDDNNNGQWDKDQDGIGNECDDDIDGDGVDNETEIAAGTNPWNKDDFPLDIDSDGDGVVDSQDDFPNNAFENKDSDGDGFGDNTDPHPNNADLPTQGTLLTPFINFNTEPNTLDWYVRNAVSYRIIYWSNSPTPQFINTTDTSYEIDNLNANGPVKIVIEAYDELGNSVFSLPVNMESGDE